MVRPGSIKTCSPIQTLSSIKPDWETIGRLDGIESGED
jgi:hypothetical protein